MKALQKLGRTEEAEAVAGAGLDRHADHPELRYLHGLLLCGHYEFEKARSVFEDLLEEHPSSPLPYLGLAWVAQLGEESPAEARRYVEESERRAGHAPRLWMDFAWILVHDPDNRGLGIRFLRRTLEAIPDESWPHLVLSVLLETSDPVGAREHMDVARANWRDETTDPKDVSNFVRDYLQLEGPRPPSLGA